MAQQVVLITGALTGIGRATAVAFASNGASVVVSGRHDDKGQALVTELRALGAEATCRVSFRIADGDALTCGFAEFSSKWRRAFSHLCGGS